MRGRELKPGAFAARLAAVWSPLMRGRELKHTDEFIVAITVSRPLCGGVN